MNDNTTIATQPSPDRITELRTLLINIIAEESAQCDRAEYRKLVTLMEVALGVSSERAP